jgi:hypothetical protein
LSLILLLFAAGCSKPFFSSVDTYSLVTIKHEVSGTEETLRTAPVSPAWNTNNAVSQRLLLEASFVMSDLKRIPADTAIDTIVDADIAEIIRLEALFPEAKKINVTIDQVKQTLWIETIQIEIIGEHPSRIVLNNSEIYQGRENPHLYPAYLDLVNSLNPPQSAP